jgi:2-C-methyl-D-erythritol 2,4-cyclodiphosphate synthase
MRIGFGYDVHRLVSGRPLILGGIAIPFEKGLLGHSDADVLLHSVCDALLGAAAMGDIGEHFPDTNPRFKNCNSLHLLKQVGEMIAKEGFQIQNIDATIIAEAPKIAPYRLEMQKNIADALQIEIACAHVKATTTEGLGAIGRGKGIASTCVALLKLRKNDADTNI